MGAKYEAIHSLFVSNGFKICFRRTLKRRGEEEGRGITITKMVKGRKGERIRLYVRGTILGYKRSKSNQYPNTSLIQIENVNSKEEVAWYAGKRMAYIYKAKVKKDGSHFRCIWGKVTRPHGNSGVVRAKFKSNLPPRSMGARVFLIELNAALLIAHSSSWEPSYTTTIPRILYVQIESEEPFCLSLLLCPWRYAPM
ncbi:unnamed protein product [Sphenostylis stenocarpa]|uniref:Ribosomal protein L35A n=1 Tax=Sphenostylis stenocarpa TaxID=92480 RepID=A0AA86VRW3_9FABA|nr:unnamed protein product [Sphenostylis stenocarpa]